MKDRMIFYQEVSDKDQEKILKFKYGRGKDKKKEDVSCLDKKYFNKEEDKDKVLGYVHLKNKEYTGREYATLSGATEKELDVYSRKKFYQRIVGYAETTDGNYLAVTRNWLFFFILFLGIIVAAAGITCGILLLQPDKVLAPDFNQVIDEEDDDCNCDMSAKIILPDGLTSFDGQVYTPTEEQRLADDKEKGQKGENYKPYSGKATIKVTLLLDDVEHLLVDTTEVEIKDGELPDVYIDFTKLDFELTPGIYYGTVTITYADGSVVQKPIKIVIYDSEKGSVGIGYSDQVYVYPSEDRISFKYECDDATTSTIVQLIIKDGNDEILLAQSGIINSGDMVTELPLNQDVKSRLQTGSYKGVMRVYFDDSADAASTSLKTDIDVTINVQ